MWYLLLIVTLIIFGCLTIPLRTYSYRKKEYVYEDGLLGSNDFNLFKFKIPDKLSFLNDKETLFYLVLLFVLMFLTAFRGDSIGNDTHDYRLIYTEINERGYLDTGSRFEMGYQYINLLLGLVFKNPYIFTFTSAVFVYSIIGIHFKKRCLSPFFALSMFFPMFFSMFTNVIRHSIASAFLIISYEFAVKKNKLACLAFAILAFLFHKTSIYFIIYLVIVLYDVKFHWKEFSWILLATFIISIFAIDFKIIIQFLIALYSSYYARYLNSSRFGSGRLGVIISIVNTSVFLLVYLISRQKRKRDYKLEWAFAFSYLSFILAMIMNSMDRLASFFELILIVPVINSVLTSRLKKKRYILCFLVFWYIINFLIIMKFRPNWNIIYPYKFMWN